MGAHGTSMALEGDCAPSYLEVLLAPLGAFRLLGRPMDQLGGHTVDLVEVLGPGGRRLAEQLRDTSSWRRRFALMDRFLLGRLDRGPRPSPEVGRAWERLVATGGAVPIRQLAREVGWSHKRLLTRFRQQVGLAPKTAARLVRFNGVWRRLDEAGAWSRPRPAMPTRPIWSASSASSPGPPRPGSWPRPATPMATAGQRSIPFKTRPRSLPNLAEDTSSAWDRERATRGGHR
jgi:hypothetical protein